jgi:hypothetical protein
MIIAKLKRAGAAAVGKKNYLFYALGEITLIVVGILVAIQVDAWRESENNKKRVSNYFTLMQNDLSDQLAEIDAQVKAELEILRDSEKLIRGYNRYKRFVTDTSFSSSLGNINNWRTFIKIDPTFEQLLVTGEVGLIGNEHVKKRIFSYYHQLRKVEAIVTENHQYVQSSFSPFVLRNSSHNLPNFQSNLYKKIVALGYVPQNIEELLSDQQNDNEFVQNNTNRSDVKLELFNSIKFRYRIAAVHLSYLENLRGDTQALADEIRKAD